MGNVSIRVKAWVPEFITASGGTAETEMLMDVRSARDTVAFARTSLENADGAIARALAGYTANNKDDVRTDSQVGRSISFEIDLSDTVEKKHVDSVTYEFIERAKIHSGRVYSGNKLHKDGFWIAERETNISVKLSILGECDFRDRPQLRREGSFSLMGQNFLQALNMRGRVNSSAFMTRVHDIARVNNASEAVLRKLSVAAGGAPS